VSIVRQDALHDSGSGQAAGQAPNGGSGPGAICIPNISTRERRKRLAGGAITFIITLAILAVLMALGASQWWRLVLFPLFAGAAIGFFQWRDKT
jgi:hypothetical protein